MLPVDIRARWEAARLTQLLNTPRVVLRDQPRTSAKSDFYENDSAQLREQLAELLSIKRATVSHHLSKLADAGLVTSTSEGHKKFYTLRLDAVRATAQQLQAKDAGLRVPEGADTDEYDRKVLKGLFPQRRLAAAASDAAEEVSGRAQAHRQGHRTRPRVHRETDQRSAGAPPPRHGQPAQRHDRLPLDGAQVGRVLPCVSVEIRAGSDNSGRLLRITRIAQRSP
jgi:DNA-binding transcriptional ArsR family regulator